MLNLGKILIIVGVIIVLVGIILSAGIKIPYLGRLPGDIRIEKPGFTFYFPLATSILISIIVSVFFWIISRFLK